MKTVRPNAEVRRGAFPYRADWRLIFECDSHRRDPRVDPHMGARWDVKKTSHGILGHTPGIGLEKDFLPVDEHTPVRREHIIRPGLKHEGEILIPIEISEKAVADVSKVDRIADASPKIGLKGTKLVEMILQQEDDFPVARAAEEIGASQTH
jgi:hypothetical protein